MSRQRFPVSDKCADCGNEIQKTCTQHRFCGECKYKRALAHARRQHESRTPEEKRWRRKLYYLRHPEAKLRRTRKKNERRRVRQKLDIVFATKERTRRNARLQRRRDKLKIAYQILMQLTNGGLDDILQRVSDDRSRSQPPHGQERSDGIVGAIAHSESQRIV